LTLGHSLLELGEAEGAVFVVVALAKNVLDDATLLFAGQVLVVVENETVDHLANVVAT
jgi:hypothetical protein